MPEDLNSFLFKKSIGRSSTRISPVSKKRSEWTKEYKALLLSWTPDECARCNLKGKGWTTLGGDFEPHHPFRRFRKWMMCCVVPLCHSCHEEVEHSSKLAREQRWIIEPKRK